MTTECHRLWGCVRLPLRIPSPPTIFCKASQLPATSACVSETELHKLPTTPPSLPLCQPQPRPLLPAPHALLAPPHSPDACHCLSSPFTRRNIASASASAAATAPPLLFSFRLWLPVPLPTPKKRGSQLGNASTVLLPIFSRFSQSQAFRFKKIQTKLPRAHSQHTIRHAQTVSVKS